MIIHSIGRDGSGHTVSYSTMSQPWHGLAFRATWERSQAADRIEAIAIQNIYRKIGKAKWTYLKEFYQFD